MIGLVDAFDGSCPSSLVCDDAHVNLPEVKVRGGGSAHVNPLKESPRLLLLSGWPRPHSATVVLFWLGRELLALCWSMAHLQNADGLHTRVNGLFVVEESVGL